MTTTERELRQHEAAGWIPWYVRVTRETDGLRLGQIYAVTTGNAPGFWAVRPVGGNIEIYADEYAVLLWRLDPDHIARRFRRAS